MVYTLDTEVVLLPSGQNALQWGFSSTSNQSRPVIHISNQSPDTSLTHLHTKGVIWYSGFIERHTNTQVFNFHVTERWQRASLKAVEEAGKINGALKWKRVRRWWSIALIAVCTGDSARNKTDPHKCTQGIFSSILRSFPDELVALGEQQRIASAGWCSTTSELGNNSGPCLPTALPTHACIRVYIHRLHTQAVLVLLPRAGLGQWASTIRLTHPPRHHHHPPPAHNLAANVVPVSLSDAMLPPPAAHSSSHDECFGFAFKSPVGALIEGFCISVARPVPEASLCLRLTHAI